MKHLLTAIFAISLSPTIGIAQSDSALHQTMVLERDYAPIHRDANKIVHYPAVEAPQVTRSKVQYANWTPLPTPSDNFATLPPGQVIATADNYQTGYIKADIGNNWNTHVDAGIRFLRNFTFDTHLFYTNGERELGHTTSDTDDWTAKMFRYNGRIAYEHIFENQSLLTTSVLAEGANYNLFPYFVNNQGFLTETDHSTQNYGYVSIDAKYDIKSTTIHLTYGHLGIDHPDYDENTIELHAQYRWYDNPNWSLVAHLHTGLYWANESHYTIKPQFEFSLYPDPQHMRRLYVVAGIGTSRPTLYNMLLQQPLIMQKSEQENAFDIYDATIGFEDNEQGYLKWKVWIGAKQTLDALTAYMLHDPEVVNWNGATHGIHMNIGNKDCFSFKAGASLEYEYNRYLGITARVNTNLYNQAMCSFGQPQVQGEIHALSSPLKNLDIDLGFDASLGREGYYESEKMDLDNIFNLTFRADYQLRNNLSFYIMGNNLLNQSYYLAPYIPAQKLNIALGAKWEF